jgi:hypothetical protein
MTKWPDAKDPSDATDYTLSKWDAVLPVGDTVASIIDVEIRPATAPPLNEDPQKRALTATSTTLWLTGGLAGQKYEVAIKVLTAQGRTFQRSATLQVKDL